MAVESAISFGGTSVNDLYTGLTEAGVNERDAGLLSAEWILENLGALARQFDYAEPFPAVAAGCGPKHALSFKHADWVDGESVVQAESTAGELGFNARFHQIEADLAALGTDVKEVFKCLTEMRQSLRNLLDEIRAELNRINIDLVDGKEKENEGPPWSVHPFEPPGAVTYMGTSTMAGKEVGLWKTSQGVLALPLIKTVMVSPLDDPRVKRAGAIARYVQESRALREAFANARAIRKKDVVAKFGNEKIGGGLRLADALAILPDDASFPTLEAMVDAVADREAAALRTTSGTDAALAATFGLGSKVDTVAAAPVRDFAPLPAAVREAFFKNGVDTVGKLAALKVRDVAVMLKKEGVTGVAEGDAAEWIATASALVKLR